MLFKLLAPVVHDFKVVVEVGVFGHFHPQQLYPLQQKPGKHLQTDTGLRTLRPEFAANGVQPGPDGIGAIAVQCSDALSALAVHMALFLLVNRLQRVR